MFLSAVRLPPLRERSPQFAALSSRIRARELEPRSLSLQLQPRKTLSLCPCFQSVFPQLTSPHRILPRESLWRGRLGLQSSLCSPSWLCPCVLPFAMGLFGQLSQPQFAESLWVGTTPHSFQNPNMIGSYETALDPLVS